MRSEPRSRSTSAVEYGRWIPSQRRACSDSLDLAVGVLGAPDDASFMTIPMSMFRAPCGGLYRRDAMTRRSQSICVLRCLMICKAPSAGVGAQVCSAFLGGSQHFRKAGRVALHFL